MSNIYIKPAYQKKRGGNKTAVWKTNPDPIPQFPFPIKKNKPERRNPIDFI